MVADGEMLSATNAPVNQRSNSSTTVMQMRSGRVLATSRLGSDREGPDGHTAVLSSQDGGYTWRLDFLGLSERIWDGVRGETRSWLVSELNPGELTATVMWVDRSDADSPWVQPETQGLLPMHVYTLTSVDGGETWSGRRKLDLGSHPSSSPTGPILRLADGVLAQPFEYWKEYADPNPARPRAMLRLSHDEGLTWTDEVVVAGHPRNELYYWDQRIATHPQTGQLVAMFWTHNPITGRDLDIHIAWGSPDGREWTTPRPTGVLGQHCAPIPIGGDSLVALYAHRSNPGGIRARMSRNFGRTWDSESDISVYRSGTGAEQGVGAARNQEDYWQDMGAWTFGHPAGTLLSDGEILAVFYGGLSATRSARWARIRIVDAGP